MVISVNLTGGGDAAGRRASGTVNGVLLSARLRLSALHQIRKPMPRTPTVAHMMATETRKARLIAASSCVDFGTSGTHEVSNRIDRIEQNFRLVRGDGVNLRSHPRGESPATRRFHSVNSVNSVKIPPC